MMYGYNYWPFSKPMFISLMFMELANPDMLFPVSVLVYKPAQECIARTLLSTPAGFLCAPLLAITHRLCTPYWCSPEQVLLGFT